VEILKISFVTYRFIKMELAMGYNTMQLSGKTMKVLMKSIWLNGNNLEMSTPRFAIW